MAKTFKNSTSNFWLDNDYNIDVLTGETIKAGKDYVKMAATLRAVGNFVSIVTGQSIPVEYNGGDDSYTDGKKVVISSNIKDKDFDPTVGLALHEGSHCKLTNFDTLKNLMDGKNIPTDIFDMITKKYFVNTEDDFDQTWMINNYIQNHVKSLLNYVEDRRIDNFVYRSAPGYQGYYQAMYNKYFHSKVVDKGLQSDEKRNLDWDSYFFRIINLTNPNRDLDALPGLRDIWNLLDLRNIGRVKNTDEALDIAFQMFNMVESNLPKPEPQGGKGTPKPKEGKKGKSQAQGTSKGQSKGKQLSPSQKSQLQRAIEKQKDFQGGTTKKSKMSKSDKKKVKAMQTSGSETKMVGEGIGKHSWESSNSKGTNCLVVKSLSQSLADSGLYETFNSKSYRTGINDNVINDGIRLGTMLGKKLQIRNESSTLTYNRLRKGKIDKRMISSLGFGNEQVFNQVFIDQFNPAVVHISIDASGSMGGSKWNKSNTAAIAIAKAATMVQNLDVVISYRSTEEISNQNCPAIFIAYNSKKDKLTKITSLFKHIHCPGITPEGLCFEAIQKSIADGNNGVDSYFLNFSDGEPYFTNKDMYYAGQTAFDHTKKQVENMRARGIKVLSYFIKGNYESETTLSRFKYMYGKDAQDVNVTKLMELAKSVNKRFATK
jgi:hypothetical protein